MLRFLTIRDIKRRFRRTDGSPLELLSRWRIELGFAGGFLAFALARPTTTTVVAGVPLALAGLGIRTWARGHLRRARELTATGPYAYHRHPLYVGSFLAGFGFVVMTGSWVVAAIFPVVFLAMYVPKILREETYLRGLHGARYERYAQQVPAWLPRLSPADPATDPWQFRWALVRRHREWRTWLGAAALLSVFCLMAWHVVPDAGRLIAWLRLTRA